MDKLKAAKVENMSTSAIRNILDTLSDQEGAPEPSEQYPLGGIVQIEGIGQVKVSDLRQVLVSRRAAEIRDMMDAHGSGLHDEIPRDGCPECEDRRGRVGP